jgi:molybdopterin-binding protein
MPRDFYSASDAARTLGISLDTLRRWDSQGRIKTRRDSGNRRIVSAKEIERLRGSGSNGEHHVSARNRFSGTVRDVKVEGLMAQVEMVVTEPAVLTAIVTADAVKELGIKPGDHVVAVIKSTSVMVER